MKTDYPSQNIEDDHGKIELRVDFEYFIILVTGDRK